MLIFEFYMVSRSLLTSIRLPSTLCSHNNHLKVSETKCQQHKEIHNVLETL